MDRMGYQVDSLCQEVSQVSADVKAMLQLLLSPLTNKVEQLQTPARRVTRRDRAAKFCRGFSETSAVDSPKSLRHVSREPSSSPSVNTNHRPAGILKTPASSSQHRVDFVQDNNSQHRAVDEMPAKNDNASNCSMKHWLTDTDKSSSLDAVSATPAVRHSQSLLRSSTNPDIIQHHVTSLVCADGQRPQTLLTSSTMKRVEKFRRRAAAASTASSTDRDTSTDL